MLKQSASRNQRYKGFKVKHVVQICALLALCIWLLNQVRNSYDKKGTGIFQKVTSEYGAIKLGRKDLDPQVKRSSGGVEADEEVDDISKPEESEDDGRGGGDDEIDGHVVEKVVEEEETEEVEDLIDEEDRDKENQIEDASLLEDQQDAAAKEEHDSAASAIVQNNLDTELAALSTDAMV